MVTDAPVHLSDLEQEHTRVLKLINDVSTRWNSTYYMLRRGLVLRESIDLYLKSE